MAERNEQLVGRYEAQVIFGSRIFVQVLKVGRYQSFRSSLGRHGFHKFMHSYFNTQPLSHSAGDYFSIMAHEV